MTKEEQRAADVAVLREHLWEHRSTIVNYMVEHECLTAQAFAAAIRLVGWNRGSFIVAELLNARDLLDA